LISVIFQCDLFQYSSITFKLSQHLCHFTR